MPNTIKETLSLSLQSTDTSTFTKKTCKLIKKRKVASKGDTSPLTYNFESGFPPLIDASKSQKEEDKEKFCKIILTKGKRKNLPCDRKILEDSDAFCKFHMVKTEPITYCTVILTKGARKNQTCNRKSMQQKNFDTADNASSNVPTDKMCKIHTLLEQRRPYNPYVDNEFDVPCDEHGNFGN